MKVGKIICLINAIIFLVYGILYFIMPTDMSAYVTKSIPTTASALIDMRATYGGMSIATGLVIGLLGLRNETLHSAVWILMIFMISMASGRMIGIIYEAEANDKMYVYLISEVLIALICAVWLSKMKTNKNKDLCKSIPK